MWLINTKSLRLKEFLSDQPPYAILSHTWAADIDEVTFQEFRKRKKVTRSKIGYKKIQFAAGQAVKDGHEWIWVDTCCIDKRSSAELSEAINSMFIYYERSEICYALLSDVEPDDDLTSPHSQFRSSRWFLRGWTLQELIAPWEVIFFSSSWTQLGRKSNLAGLLEEITAIDEDALTGKSLEEFSVAKRMSWASQRITKRPEDIAYCLFGIFKVNIPPLYGEGAKAFFRLQEEIIKWTDDHSIFAWTESCKQKGLWEVLAPSPAQFLGSRNVVAETFEHDDTASEETENDHEKEEREIHPFLLTNAGLQINLPLRCVDAKSGSYEGALECTLGKTQCSCSKSDGMDEDHALSCGSILANNRALLQLEKIKGTARVYRRTGLEFGPINDEFESELVHLW